MPSKRAMRRGSTFWPREGIQGHPQHVSSAPRMRRRGRSAQVLLVVVSLSATPSSALAQGLDDGFEAGLLASETPPGKWDSVYFAPAPGVVGGSNVRFDVDARAARS